LSLAEQLNVAVPPTVAPFAGAVTVVVGGIVSGGPPAVAPVTTSANTASAAGVPRWASWLISAARTTTVQLPAAGFCTNTFSTVSTTLGEPPAVE
jgi:hypothetical protein